MSFKRVFIFWALRLLSPSMLAGAGEIIPLGHGSKSWFRQFPCRPSLVSPSPGSAGHFSFPTPLSRRPRRLPRVAPRTMCRFIPRGPSRLIRKRRPRPGKVFPLRNMGRTTQRNRKISRQRNWRDHVCSHLNRPEVGSTASTVFQIRRRQIFIWPSAEFRWALASMARRVPRLIPLPMRKTCHPFPNHRPGWRERRSLRSSARDGFVRDGAGRSARGGSQRVKGIEPSSVAWKATALPLSYTRARLS